MTRTICATQAQRQAAMIAVLVTLLTLYFAAASGAWWAFGLLMLILGLCVPLPYLVRFVEPRRGNVTIVNVTYNDNRQVHVTAQLPAQDSTAVTVARR